jgi:hypothetical protein
LLLDWDVTSFRVLFRGLVWCGVSSRGDGVDEVYIHVWFLSSERQDLYLSRAAWKLFGVKQVCSIDEEREKFMLVRLIYMLRLYVFFLFYRC